MGKIINRGNWTLHTERSKRKLRERKERMEKEIMVNSPLTQASTNNNNKMQFYHSLETGKLLF